MRAIDKTLVDEVWRELTAYAPRAWRARRSFLDLQPHAAAFSQSLTRSSIPPCRSAWLAFSSSDLERASAAVSCARESRCSRLCRDAGLAPAVGRRSARRGAAGARQAEHASLAVLLEVFYAAARAGGV